MFRTVNALASADIAAIRLSSFGLIGNITAASYLYSTGQFYECLHEQLEKRTVKSEGPLYISPKI